MYIKKYLKLLLGVDKLDDLRFSFFKYQLSQLINLNVRLLSLFDLLSRMICVTFSSIQVYNTEKLVNRKVDIKKISTNLAY